MITVFRSLVAPPRHLILLLAASIVFAGLILWAPEAGALALLWWIGAWAVVVGALLVFESFKLRALRGRLPGGGRPAASMP